ncbi:MAG: DotA/TraY family protein [Alphaproteobacteria bacterium]|nr:DotA/TraY family protein [Alphaproteobacteria bacterium]
MTQLRLALPAERGPWTILTVLVLCGMAAGAFAQTMDPGLFSDEDDATRNLLGFLKLDGMASGLGDMLFVYNSGVLVLAGALLVYQCVAGTVDTARQGRWGFGGWQIVRIVTAVALMAPLPGGLNGAQHIVLSLARLGGDFAHAVWQPVTRDLAGVRPVRPEAGEHLRRAALARVLVAETCRHVANAGGVILITVETDSSAQAIVRRYAGAGSDMPDELCGAVAYGVHSGASSWSLPATLPAPPQGNDGTSAAVAELAEAHRRALARLLPTIQAMAADLARRFIPASAAYGQPLPEANPWLSTHGLAEQYRADIAAALDRAARRHDAAMEGLARSWDGPQSWLWAGSAFNTLAWQTGRFQAAARNVPRVALPSENLERWSPAAAGAVESVLAWLARSEMPPLLASAATGDAPASAGDAPDEIVSHLLDFISFDVTMVATGDNPVVDLASFGHELIAAALSAIGVLTGASAGSNLLESVPVVGPALDTFEAVWSVADGFVTLFLGVLLIAGVTLAHILPMIPFIRFLFGILAWLIAVVEAVLAVTIFAAFHISREEGDRLIATTTRQGWLFLPQIVLMPPLMVLGLVLGTFVFLAAMEVLNALWVPQMQRAQASGLADPVGFLAMLVLYTVIAWTLMMSAFRLIDTLPRVVLQWIGASASSGDDGAGRVTALATGSVARLAGLRLGRLAGR